MACCRVLDSGLNCICIVCQHISIMAGKQDNFFSSQISYDQVIDNVSMVSAEEAVVRTNGLSRLWRIDNKTGLSVQGLLWTSRSVDIYLVAVSHEV